MCLATQSLRAWLRFERCFSLELAQPQTPDRTSPYDRGFCLGGYWVRINTASFGGGNIPALMVPKAPFNDVPRRHFIQGQAILTSYRLNHLKGSDRTSKGQTIGGGQWGLAYQFVRLSI
jgi:hypothetical protein